MVLLNSLYFFVQLFIFHYSSGEMYKEVFKVRSGHYKSFYTVDYKYINIPNNLYDLNISFKFIRWLGFEPLCPSSINVTSIFQYGNFPLFHYDKKFQYNYHTAQKAEIFVARAEKRSSNRVFKVQSPQSGTWIFGSIFDNNDDFEHYVICLADLRVTLNGFILNPVQSLHLPTSGNLMIIPIVFNKPDGKLIELLSHELITSIRLYHLCDTCTVAISTAINRLPLISTFISAKTDGLMFSFNDTAFYTHGWTQISTRLMVYVQSFQHSSFSMNLLVQYSSVRSDKRVVFMPPLMKIRGDSLFGFRFTKSDSDSSKLSINLRSSKIVIIPFYIEPIKDQGSVLNVRISLPKPQPEYGSNYTIYACVAGVGLTDGDQLIQSATLALNNANSTRSQCRQAAVRQVSTDSEILIHFFFPEWNWWYVSLMATHSPDGSISQLSKALIKTNVSVYSDSCFHDSYLCHGKGVCLLTAIDTGVISSCQCFKPFYGLDCQGVHKPSMVRVHENKYRRNWLVYSNVAFIPAVAVAAVQRLFVLMFVYIITASFSMVYHVCYMDDPDLAYCALRVNKLAYFDHLAAVTSIWVTMMSLTTLPDRVQMILNIVMIFVCVVLADVIQKSIWFYGLPISIGLLLIVSCWIYRMVQLKCIFPPIDWWVLGLIPGLVTAGIGFMMFRLSIHKQYEYYLFHSIWHIFIALCICFVLPNTRRWTKALNQSITNHDDFELINNFLTIKSQKWYKFKKDINYYLHLDVLVNPLLERNSKWSIFKSY